MTKDEERRESGVFSRKGESARNTSNAIEVTIADASILVSMGADGATWKRSSWRCVAPDALLRLAAPRVRIDAARRFRRGVHGLVALVAENLKNDPYCGDVFIFRAKRIAPKTVERPRKTA